MARKHIGKVLPSGIFIICLTLLFSMTGNVYGFGGQMKKCTVSGSTGEPDVVLKGFPGALIQSDSSGNYSVEVPFGWSGVITPQKPGFTFEPASRPYDSVKANLTEQDYVPHAQMFIISGSAGMAGVVLDGFQELVTADEKGMYKAFVPYGWTGSVTPVKDGCEFTPKSKSYSMPVTRNYDNESYKAGPITFEVSGSVTAGGTPVAGVVLQGLPGNPTTTANGDYSVKVSYHWNGTVTPTKEGYVFDPPVKSYPNVDTPMTGQDYSGTAIQYTMSGTVGVEGVTLKGLPGNVVSEPDGQYMATVNHGWSGEVTPTLEGYAFDPPKRPYAKVMENQGSQDYKAREIIVTIAGNAGQQGVVLEGLQGADGQPVISDGKGSYSVKVRFGWNGTVTPKKEGFLFKPDTKSYTRVVRDMPAESYTPSRVRCVISGTVGHPDVVMKGFPFRVVTTVSGAYTTSVDYGWSGKVTPEKGGLEFDPPFVQYDGVKELQLTQDYVARERRYKISGKITSEHGPVVGVMVMTGLGSESATTDVDGNYELQVPFNWSGILNFFKDGYVFSTLQQRVGPVTKDMNYNFTAKVKMLTIAGEIIIDGPVPGVTVAADNGGTTAVTDAMGKYKVQVPFNWTGTITPTKEGIDFDPPSKPYESVTQDIDETLGAKLPTAPPPTQPSLGRQGPTGPSAVDSVPGGVMPPEPTGRQPGAAMPGPMRQGPGAGPQSQGGVNPEAELRMAKIKQLEKELDTLKTGPSTPGAPSSSGPGAVRDLVEVRPGLQGMVPEGSQGPIIKQMTLVDEDLRKALQDIAIEANVTIVPDPEVTGIVSCTIPAVPLEQALDIVLAGSGFSWKKSKYYYLVTSAKVASAGFAQGSETRRVKMTNLDADTAAKLLSPAFATYVQAQTGGGRTVTVTAPATLIERIVADLKQLDKRPRQVMLESKIVVLEKGDLLNLGVQWGWPTARAGVFGSDSKGVSDAQNNITNLGGKFPWGVQIGYSPDGTFTSALEMRLNLLAENSEAKILSNPQVFAQDGKKAEISVLTDEYYMMTPPLQQSALGYMTALAQLQTITSGTKLTITPYIGDNNDIVLEVAVELSDSIPKGRGSDLPVVTRRITNNTVTVRDGGTVAIAGLTENRKRSKQSKVPGLGDLPMVGSLFTNNDSDKGSREVAIFVTARLVPETSAFNPYGEPAAPREPSIGRSMMMESPGGAQDFRSQLAESLSRRSGSGY